MNPSKYFALLVAVLVALISAAPVAQHTVPNTSISQKLPEGPLVIAYANWQECDDKVLTAARNGVNVVIWMAINMVANATSNTPVITGGPNTTCVASIASQMSKEGLTTTHLISVGGWDAPHPDASFSAEAWWEEWTKWNQEVVARPEMGWYGYDGIDWDVEGVDRWNSTTNAFTLPLLNLMGMVSSMAKKQGYVVSLSPCESYLDVTNPLFDLNLTHAYAEWPLFPYHGRNTYAYLIAKYGTSFDIVNVQLYESWSHADWQIGVVKVPAAAYLESWVRNIVFGWFVDFSNTLYPSLPSTPGMDLKSQFVKLQPSQVVIGLANGWTGGKDANTTTSKALLIEPEQLESAYRALSATGTHPRGFMFWDIEDEGDIPADNSNEVASPLWMAKALNSFLHTRQ